MSHRAVIVTGALVLPMLATAPAHADATFTCQASDVNTCTVTIPLTSNMNERVSSTMPDTNPWYLGNLGGGTVKAPYGLTGPGNPDTTWDGVGGATSGHVWSAILTTDANEPTGGYAVLTFQHVTPTTAQNYRSFAVTAPSSGYRGTTITITASVSPKPAPGHLLLRRKSGTSWVTVTTFTWNTVHKRWVAHLTLPTKGGVHVPLRLRATAAPGLLQTDSPVFAVTTT